jgi:hypothetical protein
VGGIYLHPPAKPFDVRSGYDGIGIVLSESDPFVGFDFDHCVDKVTGDITDPAVARFVAALDTYTEVSPSGTGLRLLTIGKLPPEFRKNGPYECYESVRFLTLTGRTLPGAPASINPRQAAIDKVHSEIFVVKIAQRESYRTRKSAAPVGSKINMTDAQLLDRARRAANGEKFVKLFDNGDVTEFLSRGLSQSEADASLCSMLAFWTCCDAERMDLLFRQSGLCREKWEKREDYRNRTIKLAIEHCDNPFTGEVPALDLPLIINDTVMLVGDADAASTLRSAGHIAAHCPMKHWHRSYTNVLLGTAVTIFVGEPGGMSNALAIEAKNALAMQMLALPRAQQRELIIRVTVPDGFESWTNCFERGMK